MGTRPLQFLTLEALRIECLSISSCTTIVRLSSFCKLRDIFTRVLNTDSTHEFIEAIHNQCEHTSLEKLEILGNGGDRSTAIPLQVLYAFRNMKILKIRAGHFEFGENALKDITNAWPHMETLDLPRGHWGLRTSDAIPLHNLVHVANHCPRLKTLRIRLDTLQMDSPSKKPPNECIQHSLHLLDVGGYVELSDPIKVAAFLSNLFPNLRQVWLGPSEPGTFPMP